MEGGEGGEEEGIVKGKESATAGESETERWAGYSSILRDTPVYCSILLYTPVHCSILQYTPVYYSTLWYSVVYCSILQCLIYMYCGILLCTVVYYSMHSPVYCSISYVL